jgi:SAM-dependent methyltransferase
MNSSAALKQEQDGMPLLYGEAYLEWKKWHPANFGQLSRREEADFAALLRQAGVELPARAQALEIGFGNGAFLEFGSRKGWQMEGTEANPGLVECALTKGFAALHAETLTGFRRESYDLVAAFDVLEHIPLEHLPGFLAEVRRVLRPGGYFVARFPNGDSPFGRHIQNGDPTHRTAIGSIRARMLARQAGFDICYLGHEVQALWTGTGHTAHRLFAKPVRWAMNTFLNLLFSPRDPLPLCSANLELVARKAGIKQQPSGRS